MGEITFINKKEATFKKLKVDSVLYDEKVKDYRDYINQTGKL